MSGWIKHDDCRHCGGEGFFRFVSYQYDSESEPEYETDQCPECERLNEIDEKLFWAEKKNDQSRDDKATGDI